MTMSSQLIQDICTWNYVRSNTRYDSDLEYSMLAEELEEFAVSRNVTNTAKELADIIFVAVGSLYKLTGNNPQKVEDIIELVIKANHAKGTTKDRDGKVVKGKKYVNPECTIGEVLSTPPNLFTYDMKED